VTGVQTCALPICPSPSQPGAPATDRVPFARLARRERRVVYFPCPRRGWFAETSLCLTDRCPSAPRRASLWHRAIPALRHHARNGARRRNGHFPSPWLLLVRSGLSAAASGLWGSKAWLLHRCAGIPVSPPR